MKRKRKFVNSGKRYKVTTEKYECRTTKDIISYTVGDWYFYNVRQHETVVLSSDRYPQTQKFDAFVARSSQQLLQLCWSTTHDIYDDILLLQVLEAQKTSHIKHHLNSVA